MPHEKKATWKQKGADQQIFSPLPVPPPPEERKSETSNDPNEKHQRADTEIHTSHWRLFWGFFTRNEGQMVLLTGIIAVATVGNVFVFWLESESTSKQAEKLAAYARLQVCAANRSAEAAEGFAGTASLINTNLDKAVGNLRAQAQASQHMERTNVKTFSQKHPGIPDLFPIQLGVYYSPERNHL